MDQWQIERARAVPIQGEIARRGIQLRRMGAELIGPCPCCGGRDRFGVNLRKQIFNCRGCNQGGDIISLVRLIDGIDFESACQLLTGDQHAAPQRPVERPSRSPAPEPQSDQETSQRALQLWRETVPIEGTLAEHYLRHTRRLELPDELLSGEVLRFHPRCPFDAERLPCLLALWRTISGDEAVAIMRTALTSDGKKIDRKALGPIAGAAIKLTPDEDVSYGLTIGEGLETTLAGMALGFRPAWVVGCSGIRKFPVLAGIDALSILVDNDRPDRNGRHAGPEAAAECSARWTAADREVFRVTPIRPGADLWDVLEGRRKATA